ncbi:cell wall-binding repeat-containing protein [Clostridium tyrobutyricum]|uniref:cell wall-binding repeat-containing protein n=2 Tax=Bacteria TaxID=2 RepID=UPI001C37EA83|nr:cell wall-binding repeat-containing protein [Clostridium tyrobutyricum]MBV4430911.1 cell wall-binding repeat-containing protein [Clostridium tyrobutyricum]
MNKKGTKALASATLMSLVLTTALATGNVKAAANGQATRVGGTDRYETAAKVATTNFTTSDNVVLVSGEGYADSVSASVLAKKLDAPIVLTGSQTLDANAKSAIETLKAKNVYIIGGTGSISASIEDGLKSSYTVTRLGGQDRYATNMAIANKLVDLGVSKSNIIAVAGTGFADALSVAPVAAADNEILLLTKNDTDAMKATADFAKDSNVTVVGTTNVVNGDIYNQLKADKRIDGGADRFATNINVLKAFDSDLKADKLYVANATQANPDNLYADALVASAIAGKYSAPLVLVDKESSTGTTNAINYIGTKATKDTDLQVVGGTGVVSDNTINDIKEAVVGNFDGTVKSAEAVEDQTVNAKADDEELQFTVNGGIKVTADDILDAGYTIKFNTDQPVFDGDSETSTDGKLDKYALKDLYDNGNGKDSFKYQVVISKDGVVVAQSSMTKVNIIDSDTTANSIGDVTINLGGNDDDNYPELTNNTLVKGETAYITKVKGNTVDGKDDVSIINKKYESSNTFVASVDENTGKITANAKGNFDLIIKSGSSTKTISLKVTDEKRKISTAKVSTSSITLGKGANTTFDLKLYDQYGTPMMGLNGINDPTDDISQIDNNGYQFTLSDIKSSGDKIANAVLNTPSDKTDEDGKIKIKVDTADTADEAFKTGNGTLNIKNNDGKILASVSVKVNYAGSVDNYKIETQGDNTGSLDLNPDAADNDGTSKVKIKVAQYDSNNNFIGYVTDPTASKLAITVSQPNNTNILKTNDTSISTVASDGTITLQTNFEDAGNTNGKYNILSSDPNQDLGTLTITVKNSENSEIKATKTITVKDSSPVINSANFTKNVIVATDKTIDIDDLIKADDINISSANANGDGKVRIDKNGDIFVNYNPDPDNKPESGVDDIDSDSTAKFEAGKDIYLGHIVGSSTTKDGGAVKAEVNNDGTITFTNDSDDDQNVTVGIVKAHDTTPSYTTTVKVTK